MLSNLFWCVGGVAVGVVVGMTIVAFMICPPGKNLINF